MPTKLLKLEIDLRQAVELHRFDEVLVLSTAFCEAMTERLSAFPHSHPERWFLAEKLQDTLAWCLRQTARAKDQIAAEHQRLTTLNGYLGGQATPVAGTVRAEL